MIKAWFYHLSLLVLLLGAASVSYAQNGFAVQVASVTTRADAITIVNGLRARGLRAYWIQSDVAGLGMYFRIRVGGQFTNSKSAAEFGRKLVLAGLVAEYAVFKYEPAATEVAAQKADMPPALHNTGTVTAARSDRTKSNTVKGKSEVSDYLITGGAQPVEPMLGRPKDDDDTPPPRALVITSAGSPSPEKANRSSVIANADLMQGEEPRQQPRLKHADEIELDDFKEFIGQLIQGQVEPRSTGLIVTLQNRNARHRFRGTVKVTFGQNERERQQAPIQITIEPGQEQSFEVPSQGASGGYSLAIYDDRGAMQLLQQGTLGDSIGRRESPVGSNSLPSQTVTPMIPPPTTGSGEVPVQPYEEAATPGGLKTSTYPTGNPDDENGAAKEGQGVQPGDVKIIVRQVAASSENLTIEFEILAQQPLGMLIMAIRTNSMSDSKQAIMTTKQGRLPFLIPASDANGNVSYELKDEQGRLLAVGSKSLQELK